MSSYNLADEPWLPCVMKDGAVHDLSLREALRSSPDVRDVTHASPLVTASLHRLLLAILHSCFGPRDTREWGAVWKRGAFDSATLDAYLLRWHSRFDLFDSDHPFYQCASLDFAQAVPASKLVHELASGNNPTLFDHTLSNACSLSPAEAARYLVAFHAFAPGGLVSRADAIHRSATAAPLAKGAVALIKGQNLFQTLLLNMHQYCPATGHPFEGQERDCPAWERDEETRPRERWPDGYLDLLTWQSRSVRLQPEMSQQGMAVTSVVIMKGHQFPSAFHRRGHETMIAFKRKLDATANQDPWPAIGFSLHRSLWQDSTALFQRVQDKQARPLSLDWLADLAIEGWIDYSAVLPIDFLGLLTDRAKVLLWRHERLPLPLPYLNDLDLCQALGKALAMAEEVSKALQLGIGSLALLLVAPNSDRPGARQPKQEVVNSLRDCLDARPRYWSRLEIPFKQLLAEMPSDRLVDAAGLVVYGARSLPRWADILAGAAVTAFDEATDAFDGMRSVKARARSENVFRARLNACLKKYRQQSEEVIA